MDLLPQNCTSGRILGLFSFNKSTKTLAVAMFAI
jgi:hypothetical protein